MYQNNNSVSDVFKSYAIDSKDMDIYESEMMLQGMLRSF